MLIIFWREPLFVTTDMYKIQKTKQFISEIQGERVKEKLTYLCNGATLKLKTNVPSEGGGKLFS